jgi:hypothetical protein
VQRALHEFCFHNFVVGLPSYAPPTEYSAWAHPPPHVAEALAVLEDRLGKADKAQPRLLGSFEPALERHRFAVLPKLSVKLQYAWECLNGGSPFKHHIQVCVYGGRRERRKRPEECCRCADHASQ